MYVSKTRRLIERAEKIINLIHDCNNRIENYRVTLVDFDSAKEFEVIKFIYTREYLLNREIELTRVKLRLVNVYKNILADLLFEAHRQGISEFTSIIKSLNA
jgi:hypothetical protein